MNEKAKELEQVYIDKVNQYKQLEKEIVFIEGQLSILRQIKFIDESSPTRDETGTFEKREE